jgi:hypothetical protein
VAASAAGFQSLIDGVETQQNILIVPGGWHVAIRFSNGGFMAVFNEFEIHITQCYI